MFEIFIQIYSNGQWKSAKALADKNTALYYAKKGKSLIDRYRK